LSALRLTTISDDQNEAQRDAIQRGICDTEAEKKDVENGSLNYDPESPSQESSATDIYDDVFKQLVAPNSNGVKGENNYFGECTIPSVLKLSSARKETDVESDDDLFDEFLLNGDEDFESVVESGSVATVLQNPNNRTNIPLRTNFRSSLGSMTSLSSGRSGTTSISTIRQIRESTSARSASSTASGISQIQPTSLLFREKAPVKPAELNHFVSSNGVTSSDGKGNLEMPMKWRALAAAVKEKDGKRHGVSSTANLGTDKNLAVILSERNMNTHGC
jgi:hypothetical protein